MDTPTPEPQSSVDVTPEDSTTRVNKQRNLRVITAVGIAALVVIAAGLVLTQLSTDPASDGADSPEAAIEALVAAIEDGDLDAVKELLVPSERTSLGDPVYEALDELIRLGVLSDDLDTSAIRGIDLSFEDLVLSVDQVDDDLAAVHATGNVVATLDPDEAPLGAVLRGLLWLQGPDEAEPERTTEAIDLTIATLRHDGSWYISVFHSIGEHARREQGVGPIPPGTVTPRGADSPDALVDDLAEAAASLDVARLISLMNPEEGAALYRYAPLMIDPADEALAIASPEIHIDGVEYAVDQQGDRATVTVTAYTVTSTVDGPFGVQTDGFRLVDGCQQTWTKREDEVPFVDEWLEDPGAQEQFLGPGMSYEDGVMTICPDEAAAAMGMFGGLGSLGTASEEVVLDRVDGRWYLSPAATATAGILDMLASIDSLEDVFAPLLMSGSGFTYSETGAEPTLIEGLSPETTVTVPVTRPRGR